ncbi:MAG TPA: hypothetical protein EYH31_11650 [Anaerolineae bacterium]|nr:hypothetical protein [Anaerolineae bacterium]
MPTVGALVKAMPDPLVEHELFGPHEVISITWRTAVGAGLTISDTPGAVDPTSGAFNVWVLLQPSVNAVPMIASDAAGNIMTITRSVAYSCVFGDFNVNWQVDALDIQAVAGRWPCEIVLTAEIRCP